MTHEDRELTAVRYEGRRFNRIDWKGRGCHIFFRGESNAWNERRRIYSESLIGFDARILSIQAHVKTTVGKILVDCLHCTDVIYFLYVYIAGG